MHNVFMEKKDAGESRILFHLNNVQPMALNSAIFCRRISSDSP